jgi:hypothetical protein
MGSCYGGRSTLSPCRRNRIFLSNIPLPDLDFSNDAFHLGPESCLDLGFVLPAQLADGGALSVKKAQCFLASKSRIDVPHSLRTYVFEASMTNKLKHKGRPLNVGEMEAMMGYPIGYVEEAGTFQIGKPFSC